LRLASDDDLRTKLGERGWSFVKDKFHYERLARDVAALYERLLVDF